jgi:hypothetical protein
MIANLEAKTGRSLAQWVDLVHAAGLTKHGTIMTYLKTDHGLTHGYANLIALTALRAPDEPVGEDLVDAQYIGKERLRPIYDAIVAAVSTFGDDVEVAPKKTGVSLRRAKQFALVTPATRTRVDLGINLKDAAPTNRLVTAGGMCSHKVAITDSTEVDADVTQWLRTAYDQAGAPAPG